MRVAGIIAEYNPFHYGHQSLMECARTGLGADTAVVCVMSGNFVQRGDFAVVRKHVRAEAAVRSGADLVLELPLLWALSSAERFADGGVQVLQKTGLVTDLVFGSECGDADALRQVAAALDAESYRAGLRCLLDQGLPFAACRQAAVAALVGTERAALLETPNNNLAVEYCRACTRHGASMQMLTVERTGQQHGETEIAAGALASAGAIRTALARNDRKRALEQMTPAMAALYRREEAAGRAPAALENAQRAVLARLRAMGEAEFAALDRGREGLYRRLYAASRTGTSLNEICLAAKTKRYPYARLRRMALWAYLGLHPAEFPEQVPYLRVLSANETGRTLLARMRRTALAPVLTKPADVRTLGAEAQSLLALEARATDLYTLAYPRMSAAAGGSEWREGPVIL